VFSLDPWIDHTKHNYAYFVALLMCNVCIAMLSNDCFHPLVVSIRMSMCTFYDESTISELPYSVVAKQNVQILLVVMIMHVVMFCLHKRQWRICTFVGV
jgi:hypothetical protein